MKIVFNGREYDGVEQMPPEIRAQYLQVINALGDADGNGIPDILERGGLSPWRGSCNFEPGSCPVASRLIIPNTRIEHFSPSATTVNGDFKR